PPAREAPTQQAALHHARRPGATDPRRRMGPTCRPLARRAALALRARPGCGRAGGGMSRSSPTTAPADPPGCFCRELAASGLSSAAAILGSGQRANKIAAGAGRHSAAVGKPNRGLKPLARVRASKDTLGAMKSGLACVEDATSCEIIQAINATIALC